MHYKKETERHQLLTLYILSDTLGEVGEALSKAGISHFENSVEDVKVFPFVQDRSEVRRIVGAATRGNVFLVLSIFSQEILKIVKEEAKEGGVPYYDILNPFFNELRLLTGEHPSDGSVYKSKLNDDYFRRVDAVEFTVKYDDGKRLDHLNQADIILLGVSRTSKTPISVYLANNMYKVANIPIMPEISPPEELFSIPKDKIFGLVLSPEKLVSIREERLKAMSLGGQSNYASLKRVEYELDYARKLFDRLGCAVVDVTSKAIEELANYILSTIMRR